MKKVICVGSATKDIFLTVGESMVVNNPDDITVKKIMGFEFGAKIYAESYREEVGGSAVNVATSLNRCEIKPFVFSRVSKSQTGRWIIKQIGKSGVKKNYLQQNGGEESEISVIVADQKNKDHIIFRTGNSVEKFDLQKAINKFREKVDWIFMASQKTGWEKNMDIVFDFAEEKKALIALNPSGYQLDKGVGGLKKRLDKIELLMLNRDEALELLKNSEGTVKDDPRYLLEKLLDCGAKVVAITDGENGAYAGTEDKEFYHLPIFEGKIVDTVGAGDAFSGAFLTGYIETGDIKTALSWGIANSAGVVSQRGATNGLLKKGELKKKGNELEGKIEVVNRQPVISNS